VERAYTARSVLPCDTAAGALTPPACFGRAPFAVLMAYEGDRGARGLLAGAPLAIAPAAELRDFDTPADCR
jgi:CTP:molybdopterin cytidylyltransferase MocA